jgi:hypothetical protein
MKKRLTWQQRAVLDKLLEEIADDLLSDVHQRLVAAYGTHSSVAQTAHRALATINDLRCELRKPLAPYVAPHQPEQQGN